MKKFSKILLVSILGVFLVAGSAMAVPVWDHSVGDTYGISDIHDNFISWGLTDSTRAPGTYDGVTSQTGVEVWYPHAVGQTTTLIFEENFGTSDVFGIYNSSLTHMIPLFSSSSIPSDAVAVTWFDSDTDGLADDVRVSGTTYVDFGDSFAYYFTYGGSGGPETVYSESSLNDNKKGSTNLDETFMISFRGDGGDINLFGTPRTFGVDDWIIAGDYYDHGTYSDGTFKKDFDDYVVYVSEAQPVPEPATMLLLGAGLIGLAGMGRKKFFKKS